MKLFKNTALVVALAAAAASASAMSPMQDENLAAVSGQDGVSIAANLNVNIGQFTYTNKTDNNASLTMNNVKTTGLIAAAIDVVSGNTFATEFLAPNQIQQPTGSTFYTGSDVVKISMPAVSMDNSKLMAMSIDSIKMGGGNGASFGSIAMTGIDMRGTTAYIWAH